jgi:PAS domain S-box-containing protein
MSTIFQKPTTLQASLFGMILVFILPFTVVVYQLIAEINVGIEFAGKEKKGVQYNFYLRKTLEPLILHRSLTKAYLTGNESCQEMIGVLHYQIEEEIKVIDTLNSQMGATLDTTQKWIAFKKKWQSVKNNALKLPAQKSFEAQTALIADLLSLMAHVGDTSNLILDPVLESYYLMDAAVNQLPSSVENTAQAKDLGSQIVSRQQMNADEKAQLIIFSSLIKASKDEIYRGLQVSFTQNTHLKSSLDTYAKESLGAMNDFLEFINKKVITPETVEIKSVEYMEAGTQVITDQFKLYDVVSPALEKLLQDRIDKLSFKKNIVLVFAVMVLATVCYIFGAFARNLAKRKQAEQALQEAENKYRKIFENATEGIFQTTPRGHHISANPALARIYGYSSPEELIVELRDIARQLYVQPQRRAEFIAAMEENDTISGFESEIYRKDGSIIWISENARAVRNSQRELIYYEGTVEDITARKETEEALRYQQEQSERLLLNILPEAIAHRLKNEQSTIAESFSGVTVLFADIVGFTQLSAQISPIELVNLLNQIFSIFDHLAEEHGLEKIKTIGDAYMVVGGLPLPRADHAEAVANMALDMCRTLERLSIQNDQPLSMRIGINTGSVVAGVIGTKKFIYDLWGDTVNTASRMESHGVAGSIQVTETTYELLKIKYLFEERGVIHVKGKGNMTTYLLKGRKVPLLSNVMS